MNGLNTFQPLINLPLVVAALCLPTTGYTGDGDYNQLLNGDYAFSQAEVCITTSRDAPVVPTFDPDTLQLLGDTEVETLQARGVSTFDGAGNFSATGVGIGIRHSQTSAGDFPVNPPVEFICNGTYSVSADRSFELQQSCVLPAIGIGFGPRALHGRLSADRKTIIFSDTEPLVEEITLLGPGVVIAERVCTAIAADAKLL